MDNYPIECGLCNYEANAKSEKLWKMMKRLHKKKCPKTGRTEKGKVAEDVARKMKVFNKTHGHSCFTPSKDNGGTARSIDEEVVQIARTQDLRAGLYEKLRRMKAEAENSPEEGERGESSSEDEDRFDETYNLMLDDLLVLKGVPERDMCCGCGKYDDTRGVCDCGGSHRSDCAECC